MRKAKAPPRPAPPATVTSDWSQRGPEHAIRRDARATPELGVARQLSARALVQESQRGVRIVHHLDGTAVLLEVPGDGLPLGGLLLHQEDRRAGTERRRQTGSFGYRRLIGIVMRMFFT